MKNKYLKYVLIVAVIAVWGIILYRIFSAVGGNDIPTATSAASGVNIYDYPAHKKYILINQYPDPFLKTYEPEVAAAVIKDSAVKKILPPPVDMSFIRYLGMISNTDKNRKVGMLSVNGVDYMVGEGEEVAGVKVVKLGVDKVNVIYNKTSATINKNSN